MNKTKKNKIFAYIAAIFCVFVWGSTLIATQQLLESFTPVEIMFWRFFIGFITLAIMLPKRMKLIEKKHELLFFICGLTGVALYFLFQNIALIYSTASNISIIVCTSPMLIAIFGRWFLKNEKLKKNFVTGFVISIIGIGLVELNGNFILKLNPLGDLLAICAASVWTIYSIVLNKINDLGYSTIYSMRRIFFYGLICMIPAMIISGFEFSIREVIKPEHLYSLLYLGVFASALCYVLWNRVTYIFGVIKTNAYLYALPVVTILLSTVVLKEKLTIFMATGSVLTIVGLYVSEKKENN